MTSKTLAMGLLVAAGLAGTICAKAADMPALFPQPAYQDAEPPPQAEWGTGWYLRGDLTASSDNVESTLGTLAKVSTNQWNFGGGGGAGYKFNDYFRADVTADYLMPIKRTLSGTVGTDVITARSNLDRWAGLVNGYIDLGNWGGITPYIGAGVGVAGLSPNGSLSVNNTVVASASRDDYKLAWAAMAGVSYHVSPHLMLDIGYRYLDLGTYRAPVVSSAQVSPDLLNQYNNSKTDLTAHEIRLGVRYQID